MMPRALPCPTCGCGHTGCDICSQDEDAVTLTAAVTIAGVTDPVSGDCVFFASCTNCNELYNGTHIFDLVYDNTPEFNVCYSKAFAISASSPCSGSPFAPALNVEISSIDGSGDVTITLTISDNYTAVTATCVTAAPIDCSNFGPVSMTIDSATVGPGTFCCNPSGITIDFSLST